MIAILQSGSTLADALTFMAEHPRVVKSVIGYLLFSNAVSTMPSPRNSGTIAADLYLWAFRFLHLCAMNLGRVVATWVPAIKSLQTQAPESPAEKEPEKKEEGK